MTIPANPIKPNKADWLDGRWAGLAPPADEDRRGKTDVDLAKLTALGRKITEIPAGFEMHKTVQRVVEARRKAIDEGKGVDWALGEHLAFATLLDEGFNVRFQRPGQLSRHIQPAPFPFHQSKGRKPLHPAQQSARRAGPL
jgi:2-oxoglutarate dehydrogenase complex dehydrogenase (E1) component-like enzyme